MNLNLSSQIVLNKVPTKLFRPRNAVERSELTRQEKIDTEIFPTMEEGAKSIADVIEQTIREKAGHGQQCVLGLGTGLSLTPVFKELIRRNKKGLSFEHVVVFNAYEYFPLTPAAKNSAIQQLKNRFLNHIDIKEENIHTLDGSIAQESVWDHCRAYEQCIEDCGGIDIMLLSIGRMGNIATNEPGSVLTSTSRIILIDHTTREEMTLSFGNNEKVPPCSITMGIATILKARKVFVAGWGEEKAEIIRKTVEEKMSDTIPASFLQAHPDAHAVIDLSADLQTDKNHPSLARHFVYMDRQTGTLCTGMALSDHS